MNTVPLYVYHEEYITRKEIPVDFHKRWELQKGTCGFSIDSRWNIDSCGTLPVIVWAVDCDNRDPSGHNHQCQIIIKEHTCGALILLKKNTLANQHSWQECFAHTQLVIYCFCCVGMMKCTPHKTPFSSTNWTIKSIMQKQIQDRATERLDWLPPSPSVKIPSQGLHTILLSGTLKQLKFIPSSCLREKPPGRHASAFNFWEGRSCLQWFLWILTEHWRHECVVSELTLDVNTGL